MTKKKYLSLFIILIITFTASIIGGFTTALFKEPWYSQIILPSFNPPSWVFGPVWTTLYVLMSLAAWSLWMKNFNKKQLNLYFVHIFFNSIWSVIFFGFHLIGLALLNLNNPCIYYFINENLFHSKQTKFLSVSALFCLD